MWPAIYQIAHRMTYSPQIPDTLSFEDAATIPIGVKTAQITMYNQTTEGAKNSAGLYPPWEADGRGKYAGRPLVVFGGSSSVGQSGTFNTRSAA